VCIPSHLPCVAALFTLFINDAATHDVCKGKTVCPGPTPAGHELD